MARQETVDSNTPDTTPPPQPGSRRAGFLTPNHLLAIGIALVVLAIALYLTLSPTDTIS